MFTKILLLINNNLYIKITVGSKITLKLTQ